MKDQRNLLMLYKLISELCRTKQGENSSQLKRYNICLMLCESLQFVKTMCGLKWKSLKKNWQINKFKLIKVAIIFVLIFST